MNPDPMTLNHALYLHIPFCIHRCAYCDFNTYAGQSAHIPAYTDALCREIEFVSHSAGKRLTARSIFFGGGTPSLLSPRQFEQILKTIENHFDLSEPEISLEANPGTVTQESLRELRRLGFNRISFGVQSFHPDELHTLERIHDPLDVFDAVTSARRAGFENLNLDLIYGLPEQSQERWSASLRHAVSLQPEHLSLYALTLEHGTPFGRWTERGLMPTPDPDTAAEMVEWAGEFLAANRYEQYEISNWSKSGYACRHNLQYWRNQPYLGFGAGAHGYAGGMRYSNVLRIRNYIDHINTPSTLLPFPLTPATVNKTKISPYTQMQETMMLGLRLIREGVNADDFKRRFGIPLREVFGREIEHLVRLDLLEMDGAIIKLTKRGWLLGNQVFMYFVE